MLHFFGQLQRKTRTEYETTAKHYAEKLLKQPQVKAVYQAGTIRQPGISDLDILIVLDDDPRGFTHKNNSHRILPIDKQYFFLHEPFVTSETLAPNTRNLYPFGTLKKLGGKTIAFEKREEPDALPFITQEAVLGYLFWPHRVLSHKKVDWRAILPQLSATKYEYESFKTACGPLAKLQEKQLEQMLEKTEHIRAHLFEKPLQEWQKQVTDLIKDAKQVHDAMLQKIRQVLEKAGASGPSGPYFGFAPRVVWFGSEKFKEGTLVRQMPKEFAVLTSRKDAEKIRDKNVRQAFLARMNRIAQYESFVFSNNLHRFMMLTQLHTRRLP